MGIPYGILGENAHLAAGFLFCLLHFMMFFLGGGEGYVALISRGIFPIPYGSTTDSLTELKYHKLS